MHDDENVYYYSKLLEYKRLFLRQADIFKVNWIGRRCVEAVWSLPLLAKGTPRSSRIGFCLVMFQMSPRKEAPELFLNLFVMDIIIPVKQIMGKITIMVPGNTKL